MDMYLYYKMHNFIILALFMCVHFCYQGILAGIWPCGTITLLTELFVSESKAQVYGAVHDFLRSNPGSTADISKFSTLVSFYVI